MDNGNAGPLKHQKETDGRKRKAPDVMQENVATEQRSTHDDETTTSLISKHTIAFSSELKNAGLSIFSPLADLGYFTLKGSICPTNHTPIYHSLSSMTSENDILQYLDLEGKPPSMIDNDRMRSMELPKAFVDENHSIKYNNKFPFGEVEIASLHVATQRGVDLQVIDFCFGG